MDPALFTTVPRVPVVGAALISATVQRGVAAAYLSAFLELTDRGALGARPYLTDQPKTLLPAGVDPAIGLHLQSRLASAAPLVVDDYETNSAVDLSSSGGKVDTSAADLAEALLQDLTQGSGGGPIGRFFQETRGAVMTWTAPSAYVETIGPAAGLDLRSRRTLSFRVALQPGTAVTTADPGPRTLQVALEDTGGRVSAISLRAFDPVPGIYPAFGGRPGPYLETTSAVFKTFRIPLAGFSADGRDFDLSHVTRIRFLLGAPESPTGRIAIDDVELEP